jgi:hypothetical protein
MMPLELISMLGGGITGFVFRYLAEKRENDKQLVERLISLNENKDKLMNSAVKRVPLDVGKGVRQLIVLVVLFATMAAPFILPFFGIPTIVEIEGSSPEYILGLVPSFSKKFFVELNGYLYAAEYRQVLLSIVGFYFGSAAASNKS